MPTLNWVLFGELMNIAGGLVVALPNATPWIGGGVLGLDDWIFKSVSIYGLPCKSGYRWKQILFNNEALMGLFESKAFLIPFCHLGLVYRCKILSVLPIYCKNYLFVGEVCAAFWLCLPSV